jgi:hypothetical protein
MVFLSHILPFYYSVALLCSAKKSKSRTKTPIFRFNQKSLNHFTKKKINQKRKDLENKFIDVNEALNFIINKEEKEFLQKERKQIGYKK